MVGDPLVGKTIVIGGAPRTLKFGFTALRIAQKKFDGKRVQQLLDNLDVDVVCELAACGLVWEDKTVSAQKIDDWLEQEPSKYQELALAVLEGITEAYQRMRPPEKTMGEAKAPATTGAKTTADGPTSPG